MAAAMSTEATDAGDAPLLETADVGAAPPEAPAAEPPAPDGEAEGSTSVDDVIAKEA
jgi:hypothetical protein